MFYDPTMFAIVTVHSIKDCQLSTSTITSFLSSVTVMLPFEWGSTVTSLLRNILTDTLLLSLCFLRQCYLYICVQHLYSALFTI